MEHRIEVLVLLVHREIRFEGLPDFCLLVVGQIRTFRVGQRIGDDHITQVIIIKVLAYIGFRHFKFAARAVQRVEETAFVEVALLKHTGVAFIIEAEFDECVVFHRREFFRESLSVFFIQRDTEFRHHTLHSDTAHNAILRHRLDVAREIIRLIFIRVFLTPHVGIGAVHLVVVQRHRRRGALHIHLIESVVQIRQIFTRGVVVAVHRHGDLRGGATGHQQSGAEQRQRQQHGYRTFQHVTHSVVSSLNMLYSHLKMYYTIKSAVCLLANGTIL